MQLPRDSELGWGQHGNRGTAGLMPGQPADASAQAPFQARSVAPRQGGRKGLLDDVLGPDSFGDERHGVAEDPVFVLPQRRFERLPAPRLHPASRDYLQ